MMEFKKVKVQERMLGVNSKYPRMNYEFRCNIPRDVMLGGATEKGYPEEMVVLSAEVFERILILDGYRFAMREQYEEMYGEIEKR